jgi:hypothetical protein
LTTGRADLHHRSDTVVGRCTSVRPITRHAFRIKFHVRFKQGVVLIEVRCRDVRVSRDVDRRLTRFNDQLYCLRRDRATCVQQPDDRRLHGRFALGRGQMKDR